MHPDRVRAHQQSFPWLPADYLRALARIEPGRVRYGIEWFDGPKRPAELAGAALEEAFPSARWIGRRDGDPVGYEGVDQGQPVLCVWGASEQRCRARYGSIDALALAQLDPAADGRPIVSCSLQVPCVAFGPWRNAGTGIDAPCILSVGMESMAIRHLMKRMDPLWQLTLTGDDNDSCLSARKRGVGFELEHSRHGSAGDWQPATERETLAKLSAWAPGNDGSAPWAFARLSLPYGMVAPAQAVRAS